MHKPKTLIIDDDPMTCSLLETVLQMENIPTVSAQQIKNDDILALINSENPQLIILDFHLGTKETLGYVEAVRADETWHTLPILMTSGIDYREKCLEAGADDFLQKPFDWQEIIERIHKISSEFKQQEV